ncbi:MAG TPA: PHP domain-containing protein [Spirochaetota bacterium]|nr:PHP domain-containing protein [Spirochaetota bacterium]HPF06738.1 PHP domain-containing protein [Spirochaetota bacterium]HRX47608.1 PHP domain-containing protein [Spirochaetota bacterium]
MKKIDLHCHTTASDGIKTPSGLIDFAIENGVTVLAITDHDTINGLEEAINYTRGMDFHFIPGIEFSIAYKGGSFHLVGLYVDHTYTPIITKTRHLQEVRDNRIYRIIDDLESHGVFIPVEEVQNESNGGAMGRPHVARVMVKHGYANTINEVFRNYLVKGKPGYVPKERIDLDEAVSLIKGAGGIPVIAHPVSLNYKNLEEFEILLKGFIDAGVEGLEVYSSMHRPVEVEEFLRLVKKYNLIASGGSDYHGDKDEKIGYYMPSKPIPYEVYENLKR